MMFTIDLTVGPGWDAPTVETKKIRAINVREAEIFARSWLDEFQKTRPIPSPTGYRVHDENGNAVLCSSLSTYSKPIDNKTC
jgi:hypothetical protein